MKLVSIIIPVYNVEDYIVRCLDSVVNQTYSNLEVILVDDKGTDKSVEIVESYIKEHSNCNFKLIHHEKNLGLSEARNTGIKASTGEYLYFLDSDDELVENCIEKLIEPITKNPSIQIVQGATRAIPFKKYYSLEHLKDVNTYDNASFRKVFFKIGNMPVNAWNKLINKSFLIDNDLFFEPRLIHEDEMWMFRVAQRVSLYHIIQDETIIHYQTQNSIITSLESHRNFQSWTKILKTIVQEIDDLEKVGQIKRYLYELLISWEGIEPSDRLLLSKSFEKLLCDSHQFVPSMVVSLFRKSTVARIKRLCDEWLRQYCEGQKSSLIITISFFVSRLRVKFVKIL